MNGYFGYLISAVSPALLTFARGSALLPNMQPPSLLEYKAELNWHQHREHNIPHNPALVVPFHRGARIEAKKAPSPQPPISHGYRTPRSDYGWRHAGER